MSEPIQINCQTCSNQIGEEINIDGVILLHAGGALNREQRGWCAQCGTPFYWSVGDQPMQLVIQGLQIFKKRLNRGSNAG